MHVDASPRMTYLFCDKTTVTSFPAATPRSTWRRCAVLQLESMESLRPGSEARLFQKNRLLKRV